MGQKISPTGLRIGVYDDWRSRWFASKKDFGRLLIEDQTIRRWVRKEHKVAGVPRVEIERRGEEMKVIIYTARPGILIGRKGAKVDQLKEELEKLTGRKVDLAIIEVNKPELNAQLVAESLAEQLEKRASFRRVLKKTADMTMQAGARGVKLHVAGRLGGSEMARRETTRRGRIPLSTLRANIDYGFAEAATQYGHIGCKCWIYVGDFSLDGPAAKPQAMVLPTS